MSWDYNAGPTRNIDLVRTLIGDTDSTDQLLQNEELNIFLPAASPVRTADDPILLRAASHGALAIAAKFARKVTQSVVGASAILEQKSKAYVVLAKALLERAGGPAQDIQTVAAYAGGLSKAEKETRTADPDLVLPAFTRTLFQKDS